MSGLYLEEEPVVSHKAARKAKSSKGKMEAKTESPPRSRFGVWIGNLAYKTTEETLKSWLTTRLVAHKGQITRLHMPPGKAPREANKGFAYVDFDTDAMMQEAVKLSEENVDGRKLLIKCADNFEGRPASAQTIPAQIQALLPENYITGSYAGTNLSKASKAIADKQANAPCQTLFLGNLPLTATVHSITELLQRNHTRQENFRGAELQRALGLTHIRLGTFEDTGKCKGWAFADFENPMLATVALLNPRNHKFESNELKIEFASEEAVRRGKLFARKAKKGKEAMDKEKAGQVTVTPLKVGKPSEAAARPPAGKKRYFDKLEAGPEAAQSEQVARKLKRQKSR